MFRKSDGVRVDEVVVVWGFISDPLEKPSSGVVLRVNPDQNVDPVALVNELESLQRSGRVSPGADPTTFILRQTLNHYSWGADAATLALVMLATNPVTVNVASSALYDGLKAISRRLTQRKSRHQLEAAPSSHANEVRNAINTVETFYELPPGRLTAELASRDSESAVVLVSNVDGGRFRVQTVWNEAGGVLTRVDPISED